MVENQPEAYPVGQRAAKFAARLRETVGLPVGLPGDCLDADLAFLDQHTADIPVSLPNSALFLVQAWQNLIAANELPAIAERMVNDAAGHQTTRARRGLLPGAPDNLAWASKVLEMKQSNAAPGLLAGMLQTCPIRRESVDMAPPSPMVFKRPTITRVSEVTRRTQLIGDEVRSFNNAGSSSTATEKVTVTNRFTMSASVDLNQARSISGTAGVGFLDTLNIQAELQNDLARRYSLQIGNEQTYEQSSEVNIPAHTNVQIIFHWKLIWATGMLALAELAEPALEVAEVPFEVTVGLTYDKETRDIT